MATIQVYLSEEEYRNLVLLGQKLGLDSKETMKKAFRELYTREFPVEKEEGDKQ